MNPLTFNERIYRALAAFKNPGKLAQVESTGWRTSPLFVHESNFSHEGDLLDEKASEPIFDNLPFYCFRLDIKTTDPVKLEDSCHWKALITRDDTNVLAILAELCDNNLLNKVRPVWFAFQDIYWISKGDDPANPNQCGYAYNLKYGCRGHWDGLVTGLPEDAPIIKASRVFMSNLGAFVLDVMSPNVHTAIVSPDAPGRSVEWIKARSHYTLIAHGHPANSKSVAHGASVKVDAEKELTRMAHNRRAHYKTLKHPRYRFARGKMIFVRATWVGPKEWKDEGGKQIYKILEEQKDVE